MFSLALAQDSAAVSGTSGRADSTGRGIIDLDRIVVLGHRSSSFTPSAKSLVADAYAGLHKDLGSVLTSISGIDIMRTGGIGAYSTMSIRGSAASQVQVFLDGIPLNDAVGGAVDIGKIPLNNLQRITVYKATAPLELTGLNAGGIVDLQTRPGADSLAIVTAEAGSYGFLKGGALLTRTIGATHHHISVDYSHCDNDFPYTWDITEHQAGDAVEKRMDNQANTSLACLYGMAINLPVGRFSAEVNFSNATNGIFSYGTPDTNDGFVRDRVMGCHGIYKAPAGENLDFSGSVNGRFRQGLFQRESPFAIGTARKRASTAPYANAQLSLRYTPRPFLSFQALSDGCYEGYSEEDLWDLNDRKHYSQRLTGRAGLEADGAIDGLLALRLKGLIRYERDSTNGVSFAPGDLELHPELSSSWHPSGEAEARWQISRSFALSSSGRISSRSPTFFERFGHTEHAQGKPNLLPERRMDADVGISFEHSLLSSSLVGYQTVTYDKIVYVNRSQLMFVPENISRVNGMGLEWDFDCSPWKWLGCANVMTLMSNRLHSDSIPQWNGKHEPLLPDFKDRIEAKFRIGKFVLGHSALFSSGYFKGPDNIDRFEPVPQLNGYVTFDGIAHVSFTYRIDNYLERKAFDGAGTFEIFQGTPLPGRMHSVALRIVY